MPFLTIVSSPSARPLVTILPAHDLVTVGRFRPLVAGLVDHPRRVLVDHGRLRLDQLRGCGLTEPEVLTHLRQHGVARLADLRYVLYEAKGELTIVREPGAHTADPELMLREAVAYLPRDRRQDQ